MAITNSDLTTVSLNGEGTFDVLMSAVKLHLKGEYDSGRIKGTEYSSVYLGSLTQVLGQSVQFLLEKEKRSLELELLELEKELAQANIEKVREEINLAKKQLELLILQLPKMEAETLLLQRQAASQLLQDELIKAQTCKTQAEFDVIVEQKSKTAAETGFINQKKVTEIAQINSAGVDAASIVGRQSALYGAQASGFERNAEEKVAKLLIDTWNVRRTTDEGVSANSTNRLDDDSVGRAVTKLMEGIDA